MSAEQEFYHAVRENDVSRVAELLKDDGLDVNWANVADYNNTPLHMACKRGHHAIAALLLQHPSIFVNSKNLTGGTPFHTACAFHTAATVARADAVQLLLNDSRVDINLSDSYGASPFWLACFWGHLGVLKSMVASGREVDFLAAGRSLSSGKASSPLEIAQSMGKVTVIEWLKRFESDADQTRSEARIELGMTGIPILLCLFVCLFFCLALLSKKKLLIVFLDTIVPHLFALIVLLSDGYFSLPSRTTATLEAGDDRRVRFFEILGCLPVELQMILAHRMYSSPRSLVLSKESEPCFLQLFVWRESNF